jgi:hypothetical protein
VRIPETAAGATGFLQEVAPLDKQPVDDYLNSITPVQSLGLSAETRKGGVFVSAKFLLRYLETVL